MNVDVQSNAFKQFEKMEKARSKTKVQAPKHHDKL